MKKLYKRTLSLLLSLILGISLCSGIAAFAFTPETPESLALQRPELSRDAAKLLLVHIDTLRQGDYTYDSYVMQLMPEYIKVSGFYTTLDPDIPVWRDHYKKLYDAYMGLAYIAELNEVLGRCEDLLDLGKSDWTDSSWAAFNDALNALVDLLDVEESFNEFEKVTKKIPLIGKAYYLSAFGVYNPDEWLYVAISRDEIFFGGNSKWRLQDDIDEVVGKLLAAIALLEKETTITYTVTYDANGGTGAPPNQTKTHGVNLALSSTVPTRGGYDFLGWATSASATTAEYAPGATYSLDADLNLFAVWSTKTYTVTYDANGGTGAPPNQAKTHGVSLALSSTEPARAGYNFLGWATSATATTAEFAPGATYSVDADLNLFAVWSLKTYTITYDANGGMGAPSPTTKQHGVNVALSATVPTRTGHNFEGWSTSSTSTTAEYAAGGTYSANGDVTLFAVWTPIPYIITYDANGGTGAPSPTIKLHGIDVALNATVPTKTGHSFLGWSTSSTSTTAEYAAGGTYSANGHVTLFAVWKADPIPEYYLVTASYYKMSGIEGVCIFIWSDATTIKESFFRYVNSGERFEEKVGNWTVLAYYNNPSDCYCYAFKG